MDEDRRNASRKRVSGLLRPLLIAMAVALCWLAGRYYFRLNPFDGVAPPVYWVKSLTLHPRIALTALAIVILLGWRTLRPSR